MAKLLSGTRIYGNLQIDTNVAILGSNVSTSTTTGAIVVTGGVGIGGNLFAEGNVVLGSSTTSNVVVAATTTASTVNQGALVVKGGVGIANGINMSGTLLSSGVILTVDTSSATSVGSGALRTSGGASVVGNLFVGGNVILGSGTTSNVVANATTVSTSTTTGALVVKGGAGIAGNITSANVFATGVFIGSGSSTSGLFWSANNQPVAAQPGGSTTNIQYNNGGVFAGASNFTYTAASGNVVIGTTTPSTSTTTGALVVAGGAGISGNVYSDKVYIDKGVFWSANSLPYGQEHFLINTELGSVTDLTITNAYDFGLVNDSTISTFYDFGSLTVAGVVQGSQIVANSISGSKLITGTDLDIGNVTVTGNITVTGNVLTANVLPSSNVTYNLGSPNFRWKDIYLSGSSLYLDNVVLGANTVGSALQVNGVDIATVDNYDLDDISGYTDGKRQVFPLTYNLANVSFNSPWQLSVAINGVALPAFNSSPNASIVWQSYVFPANKGYTLDSTSQIKFTEPPAPRSDVFLRKQSGTTPTTIKIYPFKPIDILMASSG